MILLLSHTSTRITWQDVAKQLLGVDEAVLQKVLVQSSNSFTVDLCKLTDQADKDATLVPAKNYTVDSAYAAVDKEVEAKVPENLRIDT